MPVADDDYRKRLAKRLGQKNNSYSGPMTPGSLVGMGLDYFGNRVLGPAINKASGDISEIPNIGKSGKGTAFGAIALGSLLNPGDKGAKGSKFAIEHINKRYLQDFIEYARMRAMEGEGIAAEKWANMGMRVPDLSANRANAERAALAFVQEMIDMVASPATINRFVRFVPQREIDPLEAAINVGVKNLSRETASGAERLADRLRRRIDESFDSF